VSAEHGDPPPSNEAPIAISDAQRRMVIIGGMLALFLAAIDATIVSTAAPKMVSELGGLDLLAWVFTAYMLTSTMTLPLAGKLGDLYGRKPLFLIAVVVFVLGSLLAGLATSMFWLIVARGVQGFGSGMIFASTFAVVADLYSPLERGRVQGAFAGVFGMSSVIGPTLGGWITDVSTWRWVFLINLPVGLIAFTVILLRMPWTRINERVGRPQIDFLGAAMLTVAVVPFLLAMVWAGDRYEWASAEIIGLIAISIVALAAFLVIEIRAAEPILPLELFRIPTYRLSSVLLLLSGAGMFGAITLVPLFYQGVIGVSARTSGTLMTPMMIAIPFAAFISGQTMTRTGRYKFMLLGGSVLMAAGLLLFSTVDGGTSREAVVPRIIVIGFGLGLTLPLLQVIVQNSVPFQMMGVATASVQFFRQIGGTLGVAILTSLVLHQFRGSLPGISPRLPGVLDEPSPLLDAGELGSLETAYNGVAAAGDPPFAVILEALRFSLADAISVVFVVSATLMIAAAIITIFLPELELQRVSPVEMARRAAAERQAAAASANGQPAPPSLDGTVPDGGSPVGSDPSMPVAPPPADT
jgi:EmrB/QacA subfamily drug resistance transporter